MAHGRSWLWHNNAALLDVTRVSEFKRAYGKDTGDYWSLGRFREQKLTDPLTAGG